MKTRLILLLVALLALSARAASAVTPNTTEYVQKTQSTIVGTLVSMDDRQIVLDSDRGERVTLLMDSRTMLPVNHAPGSVMRIEFRVLENGQYYAQRLIPVDRMTERELSERDVDEGEEVEASTAAYHGGEHGEEHERSLPQTASAEPLIALVGLLSLGGALLLRVRRAGGRSS